MANQTLLKIEASWQESSSLDMKIMPQGALREFEWAISQDATRDIIKYYRRAVRNLCAKRQRIKNPISKKTGKPLKPATLKQYQSSLAGHEKDVRNYKCAIQMLIIYNYIQAHKTRARWVRELKNKGQVMDYSKGLEEDEKRFVQAYRGSGIEATLATGHNGRFNALKLAASQYFSKQNIKKALSKKRRNQIPGLKVYLGGCKGNVSRRRYYDKNSEYNHKNVVALFYYHNQAVEQLKDRIENISHVYGGSLSNLRNSDDAEKWKKHRAFDLYHELHSKLYDGFILGKKDWKWEDLEKLAKEVRTVEREFRLEQGHYQGLF